MAFVDRSDQEDAIEPKRSSFSSRKQRPIAPPTLTRTPSLQNSIETQYFVAKAPSISTSVGESDQEDVEEEDQESEFTLGRLIRQASMNSSHTSKPPRQKSRRRKRINRVSTRSKIRITSRNVPRLVILKEKLSASKLRQASSVGDRSQSQP
ncbi:hypothetical protein L2E82_22177 [Cichorium intybus]|uniref:Uncharacterized protein n=1 Tax=Cichorium intybus TaxID=13427 RepID=A0ACB9DXE5_CICIN|nr:hypothetical protein L2E82_22177 [Cichorium intybus]